MVKNPYLVGNALLALANNEEMFDFLAFQLVSYNTIIRNYAYEAMYEYSHLFLSKENKLKLFQVFKKGVYHSDGQL